MNAETNTNQLVLQPASMAMPVDISSEFGLTQSQWRVLVDQIFPNAKTQESVAMALAYCKTRKLDVFKRPVHIVPMYSAALKKEVETVWPGISEVRTTAARTGEYAGIDEVVYGPEIEREFTAERDIWENRRKTGTEQIVKKVRYPLWASVVVYRWVKGEKAAFHTKIFWEETYATQGKLEVPNAMWSKRPYGQIDKCVEAAALRKAFPEELGNTYAAEEMEGRTFDYDVADRNARRSHEPPVPPPASGPKTPPVPPTVDNVADSIDADYEDEGVIEGEVLTGDGEFNAAEFFEALEADLMQATDAASLEEAWTARDPLGVFDGDDINIGIAKAIKTRALKAIGG